MNWLERSNKVFFFLSKIKHQFLWNIVSSWRFQSIFEIGEVRKTQQKRSKKRESETTQWSEKSDI